MALRGTFSIGEGGDRKCSYILTITPEPLINISTPRPRVLGLCTETQYHHNYVQHMFRSLYCYLQFLSVSNKVQWEERFLLTFATFRVTLMPLISGRRHERSVVLETVSILRTSSWVTDAIWMGKRYWDMCTIILPRVNVELLSRTL